MLPVVRNILITALALLGIFLFFSLGIVMIAVGTAVSVATALYVWYLRAQEEDAYGKVEPIETLEEPRNQVVIDVDYEEVKK